MNAEFTHPDRLEIDASEVEHQFGLALVDAAGALFSHVGQFFSPEIRAQLQRERTAGAALAVNVQLRPTPLVEINVERIDGSTWTVISLLPVATELHDA